MPKLTVLSLLALAVACSPSSTWEGLMVSTDSQTNCHWSLPIFSRMQIEDG